jgi:hypothetical protein
MHKAPPSMATSTLSSILDEYDELEATGNTQPSFSTDDASSSPTTALEQRRSITDELQDAKYDEAWHSRTSREARGRACVVGRRGTPVRSKVANCTKPSARGGGDGAEDGGGRLGCPVDVSSFHAFLYQRIWQAGIPCSRSVAAITTDSESVDGSSNLPGSFGEKKSEKKQQGAGGCLRVYSD